MLEIKFKGKIEIKGLSKEHENEAYDFDECNSGNYNIGSYNAGSHNVGDFNTGRQNVGNYNSGRENLGSWNTGDRNEGDRNLGRYNIGNGNIGNCNMGDYNTGSFNMGDYNTGDFNTSNRSFGCFNTEEHEIYLFNKPSNWTMRDWLKSDAYELLKYAPFKQTEWIFEEEMSDEEKEENSEYKTTGGYLRFCEGRQQAWWDSLIDAKKEVIKSIPNFDPIIFEKCTGIKV